VPPPPVPEVKRMPRQQPGADTPVEHLYGPPPARGYAPSPAQIRPPSSFPHATPAGKGKCSQPAAKARKQIG